MTIKDSTLFSVIQQKCPRCHKGQMFGHSPYSTQFMKMNITCECCGLDFIQEPSFYFGAMYFSYAIQVAIFVIVYIGLRYTINPQTWTYVIWSIIFAFVILPLNYRLSRVLWISLFVPYQNQSKKTNV